MDDRLNLSFWIRSSLPSNGRDYQPARWYYSFTIDLSTHYDGQQRSKFGTVWRWLRHVQPACDTKRTRRSVFRLWCRWKKRSDRFEQRSSFHSAYCSKRDVLLSCSLSSSSTFSHETFIELPPISTWVPSTMIRMSDWAPLLMRTCFAVVPIGRRRGTSDQARVAKTKVNSCLFEKIPAPCRPANGQRTEFPFAHVRGIDYGWTPGRKFHLAYMQHSRIFDVDN